MFKNSFLQNNLNITKYFEFFLKKYFASYITNYKNKKREKFIVSQHSRQETNILSPEGLSMSNSVVY
jgi:hypothetical protein